jgi:beta-carotene ketolase (CrtO type)
MSPSSSEVVVIGGGHNGLVCACFLARAGLSVTVLESGRQPGGFIQTVELREGAGRLELGAYEHGGLRGSGVAAELELETAWGLQLIERDEVACALSDDGRALAFDADLERTVDLLGPVVGAADADRYRSFAGHSRARLRLLRLLENGPPPSMRQLAALAQTTLGAEGPRLIQTLLAPASVILRTTFEDERLRGALGHWSAHGHQSPSDPGTGAGALFLAGSHGGPAIRPAGGSRSVVDALIRCLAASGGSVVCGAPVERIEVNRGRAVAAHAGGHRFEATRALVSSIDARRVFLDLVDRGHVPPRLLTEVRGIHSGRNNVIELKVDAVVDGPAPVVGPPGFERSLILSCNTLGDLERSFAEIALGRLPARPPFLLAFPSVLEPGWAPDGRHVVWLQTFVPWELDGARWDDEQLNRAAEHVWSAAEKVLGQSLPVAERRMTGPAQWLSQHHSTCADPNHIDMSIDQLLDLRPSPSLSGYRTPLDGLYLTGAGTHPGGGVTGVPGRNAARVVLRDLGQPGPASRTRRIRADLALFRDAARAVRALRSR